MSALQKLQEFLFEEQGDHPGLTDRARQLLVTRPIASVSMAVAIGATSVLGIDTVRYDDALAAQDTMEVGQIANDISDVDGGSVTEARPAAPHQAKDKLTHGAVHLALAQIPKTEPVKVSLTDGGAIAKITSGASASPSMGIPAIPEYTEDEGRRQLERLQKLSPHKKPKLPKP